MTSLDNVPNSTIEYVIDEYIHNKRYRQILKLRFIDGLTYEKIAEEVDMSVRQVKTIIYKHGDRMLKILNK